MSMNKNGKRAAGILCPVFSLPSVYGIGGFSKEAFDFVDRLKAAGQKYWQLLPLGPTGYGDSPYQSFSTFAGNPYFIDLDTLIAEGLLTADDCIGSRQNGKSCRGSENCQDSRCGSGSQGKHIDYGRLYTERYPLLFKAYKNYMAKIKSENKADAAYAAFSGENSGWLEDYCLFMAIKDSRGGECWVNWPEGLKNHSTAALASVAEELSETVEFYKFLQYQFIRQWRTLKQYANDSGVEIIGDIPIYVAFDSADAWSHPELFQFDGENYPKAVAGCPPDAFAVTGQLWGNPLYDWGYHRAQGYDWWIKRMSYCMTLYDVVRIDHFRGFDEYYSIPYGSETAEHGHWEKGPGIELFDAMKNALGGIRVIAEDLGFLTDSVIKMVQKSGFPGMKILQFAFDSREESDYLPHNYDKNCVVYTGTHDNDTILGWYGAMAADDRELAKAYMNNDGSPHSALAWDFIRLAYASVAQTAVIPIQDVLGLGSEARINTPATTGKNWTWQMERMDSFSGEIAGRLKKLAVIYRR